MIELPILAAHQRAARRRAILDAVAVGLPAVLAVCAVAWRVAGWSALVGTGALALAALGVSAVRRSRRFDGRWLMRELDARVPSFEDSSGLLFGDPSASSALAALQRKRLEARIADAAVIDLRPRWSKRTIAWAWAVSTLVLSAALAWPEAVRVAERTRPGAQTASPPGAARITGARVRIVPPAYTGLPAREQSVLEARAPEGSRIEWSVDFDPPPASAALAFPDEGRLALRRDGRRWRATRTLERSALYRIEAPGLPRQRLHRLDATADAPPAVRVVEPQGGQLVMLRPGQRRWSVVFEARDDYGVAASALLRVTVTQGDGENVTFKERSTALAGRGDARRKRYAVTLDLAREGAAPGSDVIVQLVVSDNRAPQPQRAEGPSVILRWPAEQALAEGLDGTLQRAMPAYFRSQRQIIIDAEALIARRGRTAPDAFVDQSDALGADQAALRLRYGQFMGEEAEGGGGLALPTNDAPPAGPPPPTDDAPEPAVEAPGSDHAHEHEHEHADEAEPGATPSGGDVLAEYGHAHDSGDAATLFDPGTRSTLALALDAMWGSERALRQGRPEEALPFAHRALEYLKEAQQATRIYLLRTGPNLPPIDPSRRLTGEREGIAAGPLPAGAPRSVDVVAGEAWRALEERPGRAPPLRLDALERWARDNRARLPDALGLIAAIDTVRADPDCLACRRTLRARLWAALQPPPAQVRRRETPRAQGRRYLDALR